MASVHFLIEARRVATPNGDHLHREEPPLPSPLAEPEPPSLLLRLLEHAGWTIRTRTAGTRVAVTATRPDGFTLLRHAASPNDAAVPIFKEAVRTRDLQ